MNDSTTTAVRHGIYFQPPGSEGAPVPSPAHLMYVDGTEYDADAVRDLKAGTMQLEEANARLLGRNRDLVSELHEKDRAVRSAFNELVDDGDLDKAKANEILEALDIDPLPTKYRATVTVQFEVTCESTEDLDAVADMLRDSDFEMSNYSSDLDDFEVDSTPSVDDVQVEEDE